MQHIPSHVFPELQRQAQGQDEAESARARGATARGGGVGAEPPPETREASFPFPEQSRPHTPQLPPTPASFVLESPSEGPSVPRRQTLQIPGCRGGGDELEFEWPTPSLQRPKSRSRTSAPPSRSPTSEALSPQLLGGRVGSDADSLTRTPTPDSIKTYQFHQVASNVAAIRTLLATSPANTAASGLSPEHSPSRRESLRGSAHESSKEPIPKTPASQKSSLSAMSLSTTGSKASNATSFAYAVQHRRPDLRLLKKRSKPSQHLLQKPSILKPANPPRAASFYRPKVVEESGAIKSTTRDPPHAVQPAESIVLKLPESPRPSPPVPMNPLRKASTFALPSIVKTLSSPTQVQKLEYVDHALSRSTSAREMQSSDATAGPSKRSVLPSRQPRFESPKSTEFPIGSVARPTPLSLSSAGHAASPHHIEQHHHHHHHHHHDYRHQQHYHTMTPPEREPSIGGLKSFHHGDSYFSTFPLDTMYSKEFVPTRTPMSSEEQARKEDHSPRPEPQLPPMKEPDRVLATADVKGPSDSATASSKPRRGSGLFKMFRKNTWNETIFDHAGQATPYPIPQAATPATPTPMFTVSSPEGTIDRRRLSSIVPDNLPLPPYFARPWSRRTQSDGYPTPTPRASPLATIEDEGPSPTSDFHVRRRDHNRSSSEQLSPKSTPRSRVRPKHRHTLEKLHDDGESRSNHSTSAASSRLTESDVAIEQIHVLDFGRQNRKAPSSVSPNSIRSISPGPAVAPSAGPESDVVPPQKTNSGFKDFVLGVRRSSLAWLDRMVNDDDDESTVARIDERRNSLSRNSLTMDRRRPSLRIRGTKSSGSLLRIQRTRSSRLAKLKEELEEPTAEELQAARRERIASVDMLVTNFQQTPFAARYHDSKRAHLHQVRSLVEEGMDDDLEDDEDIQLGHEHNVPDHLPNSPLCPLHHKHRSGGKAICPLHGRYKKSAINAAVKVGPARSRRMVDYHQPGPQIQTPRKPAPERQKSQSLTRYQMEIVFDTREESSRIRTRSQAQILKAERTQSMGRIDGAWHSPETSSENVDGKRSVSRPAKVVEEDGAPVFNTRVWEKLDGRGRKRHRDGRGSERQRRRVRMRRL